MRQHFFKRELQSEGSNSMDCFEVTFCENNKTMVDAPAQNEEDDIVKIRLLLTQNTPLDRRVAERFEESKGGLVKVEFVDVPFGDLSTEIIDEAKSKIGLYDAFVTNPLVTGSVVHYNGWADLSDFINESAENLNDWADILLGYRKYIAQYEGKIIMYPIDGDVLALYYRKDVLDHFGFSHPPRTWEEYEEIAAATHGQVFQNQTLAGSCVGRLKSCAGSYWANLILASMTQTRGHWEGHLFDTRDMSVLGGSVFHEALHLAEKQVKYGDESEFEGCIVPINVNLMNEGKCVMTYNWGNSFSKYLENEEDLLLGKFGVAPTPGSSKVLDRDTMTLVDCDEDRCPYGKHYDDIGWVNHAPYLAFGGWACAVNNYTDPVKKRIATEFCAFISSKTQSIDTIILNADEPGRGGRNPYRRSHLRVDDYVKRGYEREAAQDYIDTLLTSLDSDNVVTDIRFPTASQINGVLEAHFYDHLNATKHGLIPESELLTTRQQVVSSITAEWNKIVETHDRALTTEIPVLEAYQRLRGVFVQTIDYNYLGRLRWYGLLLAALALMCSIGFAIWSLGMRKNRIVKASQPFFLILICCGTILMATAIIPSSLDDEILSKGACSRACMSIPWLVSLGWSVLFSAVFAKLWRFNRVVQGAAKFKRVRISNRDVMWPFAVLFSLNCLLLLIWTIVDPVYWERKAISDVDSIGKCTADPDSVTWKIVLPLVVGVNLIALVLANIQAYKGRHVPSEFGESGWIAMVMGSLLQLTLVGGPVLFLVQDNQRASYFITSSMLFMICMSVLLLIFVPKAVNAWRAGESSTDLTQSAKRPYSRQFGSFKSHTSAFEERARVSRVYKEKIERLRNILVRDGVDVERLFGEAGLDGLVEFISVPAPRASGDSRSFVLETLPTLAVEQNPGGEVQFDDSETSFGLHNIAEGNEEGNSESKV